MIVERANTAGTRAVPAPQILRRSSPLRILQVIEPSGGGSGRHVVDLTRGLAAGGEKVSVVYSPVRADPWFPQALASIELERLEPLDMWRSIGPRDLGSALRLSAFIRQHGPFDIVHGHSSKAGALTRLVAPREAGRIYTPHAFRIMDAALSGPGRLLYGQIEHWLAARTDLVLVGSEQEFQAALEIGVAEAKLRLIPFGIDPGPLPSRLQARATLGLNADDPVVGFVGRLEPQKAPERAVTAVAAMADKRTRLVVIGEGALLEQTQEEARRAGLAERVLFAMAIDGQMAMPAFDALIVPSRYESFGYVFLEARAAGIPIVTSAVGLAAEASEQGPDMIVVESPDDPIAWAAALETMLARGRAAEARDARPGRSVERMVREIRAVYTEVAEAPGKARAARLLTPPR